MAPFCDRKFGPSWFTTPFPALSPRAMVQPGLLWRAFLTPTLLSTKLEANSSTNYGVVSYQPNLVARQFGLSQPLPDSIFHHPQDVMWDGRQINQKIYNDRLAFAKMQALELPGFPFSTSFYVTKEFNRWWTTYYNQVSRTDQFLENMVDAFAAMAGTRPPPPSVATVEEAPKRVIIFSQFDLINISLVDTNNGFLQSRKKAAGSPLTRPSKRARSPSPEVRISISGGISTTF